MGGPGSGPRPGQGKGKKKNAAKRQRRNHLISLIGRKVSHSKNWVVLTA